MTTEERIHLYKTYEKEYFRSSFAFQLSMMGFFEAPASAKYHGNYKGGLFDHSLNVFKRLDQMTTDMKLVWSREASPFIIGMFHDLCKCDQYKLITEGEDMKQTSHWEYENKMLLSGHGAKSVMLLSTLMHLTEEEMLCIRYHMGAYEKDDWTGFDMAIRKYPNVFWTHAADMMASKVDEDDQMHRVEQL